MKYIKNWKFTVIILFLAIFSVLLVKEKKPILYNLSYKEKLDFYKLQKDFYNKIIDEQLYIYDDIITKSIDSVDKEQFIKNAFSEIIAKKQNEPNEINLDHYFLVLNKTINWYKFHYGSLYNISLYEKFNINKQNYFFKKNLLEEEFNFKNYKQEKEIKLTYENKKTI